MIYPNNSSIDQNILEARIAIELETLRRAGSGDGPPPLAAPAPAASTAIANCSASAVRQPRSPEMGITEKIKRVPIVGAIAAWAAWVLRIRRIARAAFDSEYNVKEIRAHLIEIHENIVKFQGFIELNLQRMDARIDGMDARIDGMDARIDGMDARIDGMDARIDGMDTHIDGMDARIDGLGAAVKELSEVFDAKFREAREQFQSIRREIMFQQLRLSRLSEPFAKDSGGPIAEEMTYIHDRRLDSLYEAFEEQYRGTRADIKQRLAVYLDRMKLAGAGRPEAPIVDIGCGRGEWLELMKENGLSAYGIDVNCMMVARTVSLGLDARNADLIEHLRSLADQSRSAVTAFHIIEHLPFSVLINFIDEALRVLQSGGILILETPNPENMRVGATTFYFDPTHRNPIAPDPLRSIVEHRGFCETEILRLHPAPAEERLKTKGWDFDHLNQLLFGPRDFAILARRH
ncbi:methyltransferase domain-containing protein [Candidatus Darwinibacter acetoxidans]